jgi:hypothetical protein
MGSGILERADGGKAPPESFALKIRNPTVVNSKTPRATMDLVVIECGF